MQRLMRIVEGAIVENVATQHGLDVLARLIVVALADQIIRWTANYRRPLDWGSLGYGIGLADLPTRAIPVSVRLLKRRKVEVRVHHNQTYYDGQRRRLFIAVPDILDMAERDDAPAIRRALAATHPDVVHELSHAFDDLRSKGAYVNNARSKDTQAKSADMHDDPSEANQTAWSAAYAQDPAEVNAWFQAAVSRIGDQRDGEFDDYLRAFAEHYPHYTLLEPRAQQRLLKRLYGEWQA